jgi:uncharacterized protein
MKPSFCHRADRPQAGRSLPRCPGSRLRAAALGLCLVLSAGQVVAQSADKAAPAIGAPVPPPVKSAKPLPAGVRDLKWEEMMPPSWNPRQAIDRLNLQGMSDNDPRANEVLEKLRAEWDRAPVVKALAGQKVRLPGYIVSLEGDASGVREFLLVPYFGACIHVPPPPSNQIVHVFPANKVPEGILLFPVWVTGVISIEQIDTALGSASYQMRNARVEEYLVPFK